MNELTCASIFTGGRGADMGMEAAGYVSLWGIESDLEIAEFAQSQTTATIYARSVVGFDPSILPPVDLLWASPPCQQHSVARNNNLPPRIDGDIGLDVLRFVRALCPRAFVLENVPPYQRARVFREIVTGLFGLGYFVHFDILNAADFGVPQTRLRLILRAVRGGLVPQLPAPTPWRGWYGAIADLVPSLPESRFAPWQLARLPEYVTSSAIMVHGSDVRSMPVIEADAPAFTVLANGSGNGNRPRAFLCGQNESADQFGVAYGKVPVRRDDEPALSVSVSGARPKALLVSGGQGDYKNGTKHVTMRNASETAYTITAGESRRPSRAWLGSGHVVAITNQALARFQSWPLHVPLPSDSGLARKIIGNAVPPLMAQAIADNMKDAVA